MEAIVYWQDEKVNNHGFSRNSFIRKVYGIILAELLLVSAIVLVVNLTEIRYTS